MLPDFDANPAHILKLSTRASVSLDVAVELGRPVFDVRLGEAVVADGAAMPETSLNENGDLATGKGDIGMSRGFLPVKAIAAIPQLAQHGAHLELWRGIAAFVALHTLTHLRDGGSIRQGCSFVMRLRFGHGCFRAFGFGFC